LASIVVAPVSVSLTSAQGSYLQYGTDGDNWFNGSGLSDASIVESNDAVPSVWPEHISGNGADRVSRIRDATEINTLTFELGNKFDLTGMVLWNSTEAANDGTPRTNRGFENTRLSYSTDGGNTFAGNDLLTWTDRVADASPNQGSNPPSDAATFAPEIQMLPNLVPGVTHVRMEVDNFTPGGADRIVMASELRFIGDAVAETGGDDTAVNSQDVLGVRANRTSPFAPAQIDNRFDLNRSGAVDSADVLIVRRNRTNPFNMLVELSAGSGGGGSAFNSGFSSGDDGLTDNGSSAAAVTLAAPDSTETPQQPLQFQRKCVIELPTRSKAIQENQTPIAPLWMIDLHFEEKDVLPLSFEFDFETARILQEVGRVSRFGVV
jgi:hypothetical protein